MVTPDVDGGIYHYSIDLCRELAAEGHKVVLATSTRHELRERELPFEIVTPFRIGLGGFWSRAIVRQIGLRRVVNASLFLAGLGRVVLLIHRSKPQVVHLQGLFGSYLGLLTAAFLTLGRRPVVNTVHNVSPRTRYRGYRTVGSWTFRFLGAVIVHSRQGLDRLGQAYGALPVNTAVIPMGTVLRSDLETELPPEQARKKLGLELGARTILFFGFIKPYKGLEYLIRALPLVAREVPSVRLLIAGEPKEPFARYAVLIQALGVEDRVTLQLCYIPTNEIPIWFHAAEVVALPYLDDDAVDQSAVVRVAQTFGKPLVVTAVGGLPEMLKPEDRARVVEPGNAAQLAAALTGVLQGVGNVNGTNDAGGLPLAEVGQVLACHLECYRAAIDHNRQSTK